MEQERLEQDAARAAAQDYAGRFEQEVSAEYAECVRAERAVRDADALEERVAEVGAAILESEIPRDHAAEAEARKWASPTLTRPRRAGARALNDPS